MQNHRPLPNQKSKAVKEEIMKAKNKAIADLKAKRRKGVK